MAQNDMRNFVEGGTRSLIEVTFSQAFLFIGVLGVFLIFLINNPAFDLINSILTFIGLEFAKQILFFLLMALLGFFGTFFTGDNDVLTASLIFPIIYFLIDFFYLENNFADFSLLA